jgi:thermitase
MQNKISQLARKTRAHSTLLTLLTLAIVLFSIPLTIIVLQSEQDIRQEAVAKKIVRYPAPKKMQREKYAPGRLVVRYKNSGQTSIQANDDRDKRIAARYKARIKKRDRIGIRELSIENGKEDATAAELMKDPDVESVRRVQYIYGQAAANDEFFDQQWGLQKIDAPNAWDVTEGDGKVVIAILDSGIQEDHPDLKANLVSGAKVFHETATDTKDNAGHGTHVAGIVGAVGNNAKDIAGVCPKCKLLNIKVLEGDSPTSTRGDDINLADAIYYAIDQNVNVMNLSISSDEYTPELEKAIAEAANKGIIVIAAAGNSGTNAKTYPAALDKYVIAVGAVDENGNKPQWSNYGSWVDVAAPGDKIVSTFKDNKVGELSGTSQAAPFVAGLAGLLLSEGKNPNEIKAIIEDSTDKDNNSFAHGTINAAKALQASTSNNPDDEKVEEEEEEQEEILDPCITPEASESNKEQRPTKAPRERSTLETPSAKQSKQAKQTTQNKKSGSLYERVSNNAKNLRDKLFGGSKSKPNRSNATKTQKKPTLNKRANGNAKIQTSDPCDPAVKPDASTDNDNKGDLDKTPKPTKAGKEERVARREAKGKTPRPTRARNTTSNRESRDGNAKEISNPGSGGVTKTVERTCEPATVKTPGGVTTIPCDESSVQSVTVLGYSAIIDCFSDTRQPKACSPEKMVQADLNKDGKVNQLDYNLFLIRTKTQ